MGFFVTWAMDRVVTISPEVRLLVTTGFLGSYTTFSTYGLDTITLLGLRRFMPAGLYWVGSTLLGIFSVELGMLLARLVNSARCRLP